MGVRVLALNRSGQVAARAGSFAIGALADLPPTEPDAMFAAHQLGEMLALSDYVVVITPYTPETHHLVDEKALRAMKPDAVLINIARGGVVDEGALIRVLQEGAIGGAALDVFEQEPLPADSPLWTLPNVIISPHSAGFTARYYEVIEELFGENLRRYLAGEPLLNTVDRARGY
jgi:phosphoglycerate dehydrogenase-like enzyme